LTFWRRDKSLVLSRIRFDLKMRRLLTYPGELFCGLSLFYNVGAIWSLYNAVKQTDEFVLSSKTYIATLKRAGVRIVVLKPAVLGEVSCGFSRV
jgi:hypothetical protein